MIGTVLAGARAWGVAISPDGQHAYIASGDSGGTVSVVDTGRNTLTATIQVGQQPTGVAVMPDGRHIYVTDHKAGTVC
ncbi:MAG: YncE family protein, partial [Pseudonocardiaceae bacterium]